MLDDAEQGRHLRLLEQVRLVLLDKVDRADRVVGQSMVDGLVEVAVIGEPCRRDAVELFEMVGPVMRQSTPHRIGS